jgi:hypothetical protein
MLGNRKLIVDTHCEIYDQIKSNTDDIFWNLDQHIQKNQVVPNAVYIIGREQLRLHGNQLRTLIDTAEIKVVFSNPSEGSETLKNHCYYYGIADLVLDNKIILIGGGDMDDGWPCLQYDSFLPKVLDYDENVLAISRADEIYNKTNKPYKFLFLNGRTRPHRKYLLEQLRLSGLLDQSLWTWLDLTTGLSRNITCIHHHEDLLNRPNEIKYLPVEYEFDNFQDRITTTPKVDEVFIKMHLFKNSWGDIYLKAEPYIDTYFSLVTETVFEYPYSFRTEKIWKPVAMGHPWIVAANQGYYRDMHNLGFKSFGNVIDESFDNIENTQDRLERIAQVVKDLCQQDLAAFVKECYNVCKYNQQHLAEMRTKVRQEFPDRFFQFIKKYQFDE